MQLWKKFTELVVTKVLRLGKGAFIELTNNDGSVSRLSLSEQAVLDGVTAGTVTASKAVVVDSNKDASAFRNVGVVNLDAGSSGTAGSLDVFPATASKGKTAFTAADNAGNTTTTVTTAEQAGARTYTVPDAGASASFVMTEGAQTVNGVKTFGSVPSIPGVKQGAPTAKTTSATLSAAEVLAGIITVNQGAGGTSAQQLPLAADMDTALPAFAAGDAFDFSVINTSTVDAEDASVTTNTGWTLVGNMDVHAYSAAGSLNASARFRARKTGSAAWTLYRLS
jgi:hypothetical protein